MLRPRTAFALLLGAILTTGCASGHVEPTRVAGRYAFVAYDGVLLPIVGGGCDQVIAVDALKRETYFCGSYRDGLLLHYKTSVVYISQTAVEEIASVAAEIGQVIVPPDGTYAAILTRKGTSRARVTILRAYERSMEIEVPFATSMLRASHGELFVAAPDEFLRLVILGDGSSKVSLAGATFLEARGWKYITTDDIVLTEGVPRRRLAVGPGLDGMIRMPDVAAVMLVQYVGPKGRTSIRVLQLDGTDAVEVCRSSRWGAESFQGWVDAEVLENLGSWKQRIVRAYELINEGQER